MDQSIQAQSAQYSSTQEVLERVQAGEEASKILVGVLRATHYFHGYHGKIYDEGIDGEEVELTPEEFIDRHRSCQWIANPI